MDLSLHTARYRTFIIHTYQNNNQMEPNIQDRGIVRHRPRKCDWGQFLGSINLGEVTPGCSGQLMTIDDCVIQVCLGMEALEDLLTSMSEEGFSKTDYNVMENSCNTFTEVYLIIGV